MIDKQVADLAAARAELAGWLALLARAVKVGRSASDELAPGHVGEAG